MYVLLQDHAMLGSPGLHHMVRDRNATISCTTNKWCVTVSTTWRLEALGTPIHTQVHVHQNNGTYIACVVFYVTSCAYNTLGQLDKGY